MIWISLGLCCYGCVLVKATCQLNMELALQYQAKLFTSLADGFVTPLFLFIFLSSPANCNVSGLAWPARTPYAIKSVTKNRLLTLTHITQAIGW